MIILYKILYLHNLNKYYHIFVLKKVFERLDQWIENENHARSKGGTLKIAHCKIKVLGQTALIEAA